jgi:N-acylglucosamine-6-phosphate 2-epimerase
VSTDRLPPAGLVVSVMPTPTTPWRTLGDIARLAEAAERGGAVAVKVDGPAAVRSVRAATSLPVFAVHIAEGRDGRTVITPSVGHAHDLLEAGADLVELEADADARAALGQDVGGLLRAVADLGAPVKAGVRRVADGVTAQQAGAVVVGSSVLGYGRGVASTAPGPDLALVADLVAALDVPVSAERGFGAMADVQRARALGARYVVVGSAITDPAHLTRSFAAAFE